MDDVVEEAIDRFREANDATEQQYRDSVDDITFLKGGSQWPSALKSDREIDGRPCLEVNKLPVFADQVIGDIRQNEPSVKVKPVDSYGDIKTAEIFQGLIRNIELQSDAEIAYDTAVESAVICGMGAWRIVTEYAQDDSFDQDIKIKRVKNPFTIYWDPNSQDWSRDDSQYAFVTERVRREIFEKKYPKASLIDFNSSRDKAPLWVDEKTIRVAEYWRKKTVKKTIYLMKPTSRQTGRVGDLFITEEKPDPGKLELDPNFKWEVIRDRIVESYKLEWCLLSAVEQLEEIRDWPGKYIPLIMCYGKELNIENESDYRGIVRNSKDPQRLYNYSRSAGAEQISLVPKVPYLVTAKQISNYKAIWDTAHKRSWPYLPYEPDPMNPQLIPHRTEPIQVSTGIQAEIMAADQEIRDTTGLQQANMGQKSNEKSGRAILARQREGDTANYAYYDNLGRAMKYQAKVLIDLIPKIYDTPRIVRVIGPDNMDRLVPVNIEFEEEGKRRIYDLTVGKYDVAVTIGPSFATQRDEAAQGMISFVEAVPAAGPLLGDLIAKNLDWPGAQEMANRLKLLLPPQLQGGGGAPPPPPPPPNPAELIQLKNLEEEAKGKAITNEQEFEKLRRLKVGLPMEPKEPKEKKDNASKK